MNLHQDDAFAPLTEGQCKAETGPADPADAIPVTPVPSEAVPATFRHRRYGDPVATWAYRNETGELLGYAARFDSASGKQVLPRTWCRLADGRTEWRWKSFVAPRPLYGLDRLSARPTAPVLLVEGEKTADAAQQLFADFVVLTWPGGSKAVGRVNWHPLRGRQVTLWPDADDEGHAAMDQIERLFGSVGVGSIRRVELPPGLPEGWDLADAIPEGMDVHELLASALRIPASAILPPGYRFTPTGLVWQEGDDDTPEILIAGPFDVLAETRDREGTAWGVLLGWDDHDGRPHKHPLPRSVLAGDGAEARRILLDGGLYIAAGRKQREKLNNFLITVRSPNRVRATGRVGWHDDVFVLPDETIGVAACNEQLLLQHSGSFKHAFRQRGSLAEWQDSVARLAVGNSRLVLAISAAFAAVLLEPCKAESGGIHFRGPSSTGKSTALIMAASVWGGGEPGGYVRSWRATANGLEGVALGHCDTLLCLDELSQVSPREAGEAAYMLGNGSGKSRSNREGHARHAAQWRVLFLSSGELSLADKIAEDGRGRRAAAGQAVRLIDLPADAGAGMGLFEELHGLASADAFARHVKAASTSNYGTVARTFLSHVTRELDDVAKAVVTYSQQFVSEQVDTSADGQVHRAAQRFALIGTAGEIAIGAGILPWPQGTALEAAARCLKDWIAARGGTEAAELQGALAQVRAFISAHGVARFVPAWDSDADHIVRDIAGYRKSVGEGWDYYVTSSCWRDELCKGFDPAMTAAMLMERRYLVATEAGRYSATMRVPGFGKQRLYHLSSTLLEQGHD